jgi:hypothetical protein
MQVDLLPFDATVRAQFSLMPFHPFLFLSLVLVLAPLGSRASESLSSEKVPQKLDLQKTADSLYNEKAAQKLDLSKQAIFGPQSSRFRYDARMIRAAEIAQARARGHSISRCWRYVKTALLAAKIIDSYPSTAYAKQAGKELQTRYGFTKISVIDPFSAPVGAVLVYGGRGAGHVEIRTSYGFCSDFQSLKPSQRPLIGVYIKPRA